MAETISQAHLAVLEKTLRELDDERLNFGTDKFYRGQLLAKGPLVGGAGAERRIGFCVQIRKRAGGFGSDTVLLRHLDGGLTPHTNQFFYTLTDKQESELAPLFAALLEEEDFAGNHVYTLGANSEGNKQPHAGFIVDAEHAPEREPELSPVMIRTVSEGPDGKPQTTITAFIG